MNPDIKLTVPFLDLYAQYLTIKNDIDSAITKVLKETSFIGGANLKDFESNFAKFCGVTYCIGVSNGTDAIEILLKSLGIGKGHGVLVPANSFIATSEAVSCVGATPIFIDCDPHSYTIDVNQLEKVYSDFSNKYDIKAIIPVHLYGTPAEMDEVNGFAKKYNLFVIEDAAQAHGAYYKNKKIGSFSDGVCFSFYPGKNLGAYGDAGAIVTNNSDLAKNMRMYSNHGRIDKYDHLIEGINSRLDGMQAAILNAKLPYLENWSKKRLEIAKKYNSLLSDIEEISLPEIFSDRIQVFHLYVIRTSQRTKLIEYLNFKGIQTGIHYPIALPNLKAYKHLDYSPTDFPFATQFQSEILSLPIFPEITNEQINYVADSIKAFFSKRC